MFSQTSALISWQIVTVKTATALLDNNGNLTATPALAGDIFRAYTFNDPSLGGQSPVQPPTFTAPIVCVESPPTAGGVWSVVNPDSLTQEEFEYWKGQADAAGARRKWISVDDLQPSTATATASAGGDGDNAPKPQPAGSGAGSGAGSSGSGSIPQQILIAAAPGADAGGSDLPWWLILAVPVGLKLGVAAGVGAGLVTLFLTAKKAVADEIGGDKP